MKPELEEKLTKQFPLLYADVGADPTVSCMAFGFECNDGWYELLHEVSSKLELIIQKYIEEHDDCENYPRAAQVKEKFGSLSFYMTHYLDEFDDPIREAEAKSMITCEYCGKIGKIRVGGWMVTLCDGCDKKRDEER